MLLDIQALQSMSVLTVLTGILILYFLLSSAQRIYNIYFHPLSKFPGPWYRSAFHFPYHYEQIKGHAPHNYIKLHEKHGPVVRIGPDQLSFTCSQAYKDIYGFHSHRRQVPKDFKRFPNVPIDWPLFGSDDGEHSRLRRLVAHAFSETALREQEPLIQSHIHGLVQKIRSVIDVDPETHFDMSKYFDLLSFDIITDLTYGESFDGVRTGETNQLLKDLYQGSKLNPILLTSWDYAPLMWLLKFLFSLPKAKELQEGEEKGQKDRMNRRRAKGTDAKKDFMSYILVDEGKDNDSLTENEILGLARLFVGAGGEEPASMMSTILYYLLTNPSAHDRARKEIRDAFVSIEEINNVKLAQLPYLGAVISETFRIHHSGAQRFSRRTTRTEMIGGYEVPPNTSVDVNHHVIGRVSANYAEPTFFAPERWLSETLDQFKFDDKAALQPFATGPRACLGKNVAYLEIRTTLAYLLWTFDMELIGDSKDWIQGQKMKLIWHRPPMNVGFKVR
ncbi:cytochrome P450 [Pseudovirgaria hyperparasitica]|uniref:Cytochrome P450 n=1 Tax=Pseudovirgaria hyperparasitica TaxID=470096 RepID=A0A6A6W0H2_9PEZI|nr:cytochrome P450 [Pseudovirgaria hyperparasitica]KAF2755430.1 cytochrome P450 [Pseudovirgaria hyperparasitica]